MIVPGASTQPDRLRPLCHIAIEAEDDSRRLRMKKVMDEYGHAVTVLRRGDDELGRRRAGAAPDVVVLIVTPAESDVPQAIRELRERTADIPIVVVLPGPARRSDVRKALKAGAEGVVLDEELERAFGPTLEAVRNGQLAMPHALREYVIREPLSHREKQILGLVVTGSTNREIAERLYLAESTVKTHLSSAFGKLNARSRSEAAALILDPDEGLGPGILNLTPAPAARN
jgi:DNA-binding NarL/FixJ family response regulator